MTRRVAATNTNADRRQALYDELIQARASLPAFSAVQLSVARTVAKMLAGDNIDPRDAGVVAELIKLLPPERTEPPINLELLSDRQLDQLQRLVEIGHGERPSPITRRERSLRQRDADQLVRLLDRAEKRDGKLSATEVIEVQNLIGYLLRPMVPIAYQLWPAPAPPTPAEPTPAPPPPQPAPSHVVPLVDSGVPYWSVGRR